MRNLPLNRSSGERYFILLLLLVAFAALAQVRAAEVLPFDPARISRLSIDSIPRSIAIRQGDDVWLGYDVENAFVFKVWQAAAGKPGVILKGFKAQSAGTVLFKEKAGSDWQMEREGRNIPLTVRYLGCSQNKENFELRWELNHPDGTIQLSERIPMAAATGSSRVSRELRVESLKKGASLILPSVYGEAWTLKGADGKTVNSLSGSAWHTLSLR